MCPGFSPEILRGGRSLNVYADTSLLQPSGHYSNGLVNCGYHEISGYRHAQSRLCSHQVTSNWQLVGPLPALVDPLPELTSVGRTLCAYRRPLPMYCARLCA